MNIRYGILAALLLGLCNPCNAQLSEKFVVISPSSEPAAPDESDRQAISCSAADLLMALGCYQEAADMYSLIIDQSEMRQDTANLDRACIGLYRAQLLLNEVSKYAGHMAKCRPEVMAPLLGKANWDPMFITNPVFEPDMTWLNTAVPGVNYKVTVQFDIDEFGKAGNFDFKAEDKLYLRSPVLKSLKQARYMPAVKNGKTVKKSKNIVEVVFCLDRGSSCANDN